MSSNEWHEPISKNVRFKPCICGYNRHKAVHDYYFDGRFFVGSGRWFYVCNKCKLIGYSGVSHRDAKIKWNLMIDDVEAGTKAPEYYKM